MSTVNRAGTTPYQPVPQAPGPPACSVVPFEARLAEVARAGQASHPTDVQARPTEAPVAPSEVNPQTRIRALVQAELSSALGPAVPASLVNKVTEQMLLHPATADGLRRWIQSVDHGGARPVQSFENAEPRPRRFADDWSQSSGRHG